jgi:hypothetical protein
MARSYFRLWVGGAQICRDDLTHYTLRFASKGPDGNSLALYRDGKRVTKPWGLFADVEQDADEAPSVEGAP